MRAIQDVGSGLKRLVQDCTCLTLFVGSGLGTRYSVFPPKPLPTAQIDSKWKGQDIAVLADLGLYCF